MPLTRPVKAGYGAADFGMAGVEILLQLFLLEFYTRSVGLSPSLTGYALAIAVAWDAVTDPLMGAVSDRTRTRWGMRRPYMVGGSLLFALSVVPDLSFDSGCPIANWSKTTTPAGASGICGARPSFIIVMR